MNFTEMNRQQIREEIIGATGDDQISEDVLEDMVYRLENLEDGSPDVFWAVVEAVFTQHAV